MLLRSQVVRLDSFAAARASVLTLIFKKSQYNRNENSRRKRVLEYLQASEKGSRWSAAQERSSFRKKLTLLLREARNHQDILVAEEALRCAMRRPDVLRNFDSVWTQDALGACKSLAEVHLLQEHLQAFEAFAETASPLQRVVPRLLTSDRPPRSDDLSSLPADNEVAVSDRREGTTVAPASRGAEPAGMDVSMATLRRLSKVRSIGAARPNNAMMRYFVQQGLVSSETELQQLTEALRSRPERIAFRVHLSSPYGVAVDHLLLQREGIERIPWLPREFGAYCIRTGATVPYAVLQSNRRLLQRLARDQLISYQSSSSMLSVFFLRPGPEDAVLDACASPGSKSSLILDSIGSLSGRSVVVANDHSTDRSRALMERFRSSSFPQLTVTHGDASRRGSDFQFDKVLVDAPCSGESRLGRDETNWRIWHPLRGVEFYHRQVALLRRAVQSTRVGGQVLYSTCTFNPLENEAVIATVLQEFPNALQLVALPAYGGGADAPRLSPALSRWLVPCKDGGLCETAQEAERRGETGLPVHLFSPNNEVGHLIAMHARRLFPHRSKGAEGFFYALLEVIAPLSETSLDTSFTAPSRVFPEPSSELYRVCAGLLQTSSASDTTSSDPLACHGLVAVWDESSGVQLATQAAVKYLRGDEDPRTRMRSLGVTVLDSKGELTDTGADLVMQLAPHSSRVTSLPLHWVHLLLHNRTLTVRVAHHHERCVLTLLHGAPDDIRRHYQLHLSPSEAEQYEVSNKFLFPLYAGSTPQEGFCAVVSVSWTVGQEAGMKPWGLPVRIETSRDGRLQFILLSSSTRRHLSISVLGQLRGHTLKSAPAQSPAPDAQPSAFMPSELLYGTTLSPYSTAPATPLEKCSAANAASDAPAVFHF